MVKKEQSYQELKQQLDTILRQLQDEDTDIDEAISLHKEGQKVLKQLDSYLAHVAKDSDIKTAVKKDL
jgi:exodeoxyribonuclease VII small subunit